MSLSPLKFNPAPGYWSKPREQFGRFSNTIWNNTKSKFHNDMKTGPGLNLNMRKEANYFPRIPLIFSVLWTWKRWKRKGLEKKQKQSRNIMVISSDDNGDDLDDKTNIADVADGSNHSFLLSPRPPRLFICPPETLPFKTLPSKQISNTLRCIFPSILNRN